MLLPAIVDVSTSLFQFFLRRLITLESKCRGVWQFQTVLVISEQLQRSRGNIIQRFISQFAGYESEGITALATQEQCSGYCINFLYNSRIAPLPSHKTSGLHFSVPSPTPLSALSKCLIPDLQHPLLFHFWCCISYGFQRVHLSFDLHHPLLSWAPPGVKKIQFSSDQLHSQISLLSCTVNALQS